MRRLKYIWLYLLLSGTAAFFQLALGAAAQQHSAASSESARPERDGQHDFDFEIGKWKAHVKNLGHRLSGSKDWEEFEGTVVTTPFMDGNGNLSEMNVDGATSHRHIQIIAVRLYNATSRQWSIYGASTKTGVFDPPQIGQFDGDRGEFYTSDMYEGRAIYIRFVWQNVSPMATHFEQAFSSDGGKTWEVNWIYDGTRIAGNP
ncbi:MAG: hypothetical protein ABSE28_23580 [Candidatus Sulfotelmatobacter sp.]|jgi:hypothetical protein